MTENLVFSGNYCNLKGLYSISGLTKKGSSFMTTASIAITNKLTTNIKLSYSCMPIIASSGFHHQSQSSPDQDCLR